MENFCKKICIENLKIQECPNARDIKKKDISNIQSFLID